MDPTGRPCRFVHQSGVTFPVGADPDYRVTEGLYAFIGDPDAVFVDGNGTIVRIVHGAITASQLRRWEHAPCPDRYSQRKVSDAATGVATAQIARTTQLSAGTEPAIPNVACRPADNAAAGRAREKRGETTRELGQRDEHAAQQEQHQIEAIGGGEIDLGAQDPGEEEAEAAERQGGEQHDGHRFGDRRAPGARVPPEPESRSGSRTAAWTSSTSTTVVIFAPTRRSRRSGVAPSRFRTP